MSWSRTLKIRQQLRTHIESGEEIGLFFSDLRGFSAYAAREGDHAAYELAEEHEAILRDEIGEDGIVVKTLGDGVMAAFEEPVDALHAAVALQRALRDRNEKPPNASIHVGIGVSSGTPIMTDVDFIGHTVNLAQRLSSIAKGSQVLTTSSVQSRARLPDDVRYVPLGERTLKGVGREHIVEVAWLEEVARVSDAKDRLTLVLTKRGTIVIEFAKDARRDAADALRNLLDVGIAEAGLSAMLQRAAARIAFRALRGSTSRLEGTIERRIDSVHLSLARRGLSLRIGSRTLLLPSVDLAAARQFVEAAARMRSAASA
ncbi:MAG: adenylate/guanylate cyclase domain-containing protein [bacterium]